MSFADLGLKPEILRAIEDVGYTTPTPIQAQAIPIVLQQRDVLGIAQTGTGKTAGFTLPMIEILASGRAKARMPRSVILEPTRELAAQVAENFELYGKYEKLTYALLIGGESMDDQIRKLDRGVDVLIATPGRLMDLHKRGKVLLPDVKILVIDEADRMLDMGFIPDIEEIVHQLPVIRQTLLFSATMPKEIRRLAERFLTNPKQISVEPSIKPAASVAQHIVFVDKADKRAALRSLLRSEDVRNALVFCNRKRDIATVYKSLRRHGFDAGELHGDMVQSARTEMLERFKNGDVRILVCSDVAARGLDISELSHVFNFDVPTTSDDYIHRIGRTGRAGRKGRAFSFATMDDAKYVDNIRRLEGLPLVTAVPDDVDVIAETMDAYFELTADETGARRRGKTGKPSGEAAKTKEKAKDTTKAAGDSKSKPASKSPSKAPGTAPGKAKDAKSRANGPVEERATEAKPHAPAGKTSEKEKTKDGRKPGTDNTGGAVKRGGQRGDDDRVVGMGDHTPAFLLRTIPKSGRKTGQS